MYNNSNNGYFLLLIIRSWNVNSQQFKPHPSLPFPLRLRVKLMDRKWCDSKSTALLLQWQWWEATEGQPTLAEQRDQSRGQRRQPGGLWWWGCSIQRGWLLYRRVRWAKGKEGVHWDQSHRSDPSISRGTGTHPPLDSIFIKPAGKSKSKRKQTLSVSSTSRVKCNASLPSAHCHLHFTKLCFVKLQQDDHY